MKLDIYCHRCGSRKVRRDADAVWNIDLQAWELCSIYDDTLCEECGRETGLEFIKVDDATVALIIATDGVVPSRHYRRS